MKDKILHGVAATLVLWSCACSGGAELTVPGPEQGNDIELFKAVIEHVRQGENYYAASGGELHSRHYPTSSVFNWRLPTLTVFLSALPSYNVAARVLLALGIATTALWCVYLIRHKQELMCMVALPILLSMMPTWHANVLALHEIWAGQLISLSLVLRLLGLVSPSIAVGAVALSVRELALPFVAVMGAAAWYEGKRREAVGWGAVAAAFCAAMIGHRSLAHSFAPSDATSNSWFVLGGWCQVVRTARTHLALTYLPTPLLGVVVSTTWMGLWVWRSPGTFRVALVVSVYLAAFAVVGRPDNFYWGFMIAPVLLLGIVGWLVVLQSRITKVTAGHASRAVMDHG